MNNILQKSTNIHGSCVAINGQGVLLLGESGAGKSDLALRLLDRGAKLVSDDRVDLRVRKGELIATPPKNIEGFIELSGVGIIRVDNLDEAVLKLAIKLVARQDVERMPEISYYEIMGIKIRELSLHSFDVSTPIKIERFINDF